MQNIHKAPKNDHFLQTEKDVVSLRYAMALLSVVTLTYLFGCTMLYSTSSIIAGASYFAKQRTWGLIGAVCMFIIWLIGYKKISQYCWLYIVTTVILLLIARYCYPSIKGAYRWIKIPGFGSLQPSEFAKLAAILFTAKFCTENIRFINKPNSLLKGMPPVGVIIASILMGKDLGTSCLISFVVLVIYFVAGLKLRWFLIPPAITPLAYLYIKNFDTMRWARLSSFMDPEKFKTGIGFQLWRSLLALGSGGWSGVGFTESRMKTAYLPEDHTDFILSIVGEELGFFFICLVIILYVTIMFFGVQISIRARTKHGMLLGIGVTSLVVFQSLINIGVVSGALPTKGMPAAFISYGGSNLILCLCCIGILISIAYDSYSPDYNSKIFSKLKTALQILLKKTQKKKEKNIKHGIV